MWRALLGIPSDIECPSADNKVVKQQLNDCQRTHKKLCQKHPPLLYSISLDLIKQQPKINREAKEELFILSCKPELNALQL